MLQKLELYNKEVLRCIIPAIKHRFGNRYPLLTDAG